jgi:hypothetical protein
VTWMRKASLDQARHTRAGARVVQRSWCAVVAQNGLPQESRDALTDCYLLITIALSAGTSI